MEYNDAGGRVFTWSIMMQEVDFCLSLGWVC